MCWMCVLCVVAAHSQSEIPFVRWEGHVVATFSLFDSRECRRFVGCHDRLEARCQAEFCSGDVAFPNVDASVARPTGQMHANVATLCKARLETNCSFLEPFLDLIALVY